MSERALSSVILVIGGTGSFDHAFVAYALRQGVQEVHVLSRDEFKQELVHTLAQGVKSIDLLASPPLRDCNGWEREHEGRTLACCGMLDGMVC